MFAFKERKNKFWLLVLVFQDTYSTAGSWRATNLWSTAYYDILLQTSSATKYVFRE